MSLSQIELVWVRVRKEWECFWVNLREDNNVFESRMAVFESNMAEFKMAAITKLSQNEWVKFFCGKWLNPWWQNSRWLPSLSWVRMNEFESDWTSLSQSFVQNGWIQDGRIEDGCHYQFEWECMSEVFLCKWLNHRWQNSRWLPSSSWVKMNKWSFFVQNGWFQDGRVQDGCHYQFEWECMSEFFFV